MKKDKKKEVNRDIPLRGHWEKRNDDNLTQGRSKEKMEKTYKILEWTFILALIALVSFVIYYRFEL
jgi:hypothetical protein